MRPKHVGVVILLIAVMATPGWAALEYVRSIELAFNTTQVFDVSGGIFRLNGGNALNLDVSHIKVHGSSTFDYDIVDAQLTVGDQSTLTNDYSTGPTLYKANGSFTSGQTLSLTGTIEEADTGTDVYTGSLLDLAILSTFDVNETGFNTLTAVQQALDITGGELMTGANSNIKMIEDGASTAWTLNFCRQPTAGGGFVEDFQDDIFCTSGSRISIDAPRIPEPVSVVLLGLGGLLMRRRRV